MKLKGIFLLSWILSISLPTVYCGTMGELEAASEKIYLGFFLGAAKANSIGISQYGTAFPLEGGVLAVNALGGSNRPSAGLIGGHIGYLWSEIGSSFFCSLTPALELEGFYLGKTNFSSDNLNNETPNLPLHRFSVNYPIRTGVFLTNAVLNFNSLHYKQLKPYVGAGFGAALLRISNAASIQTVPAQPGIFHYNSNPNGSDASFAAQTKIGFQWDFFENSSLFIEYRWLYIANSGYTFGSTVYAGHDPTAAWRVELNHQRYNAAAIGYQFSI